MKNTNIVGEPFSKYVNDQIEQRQLVYGDGLDSNRDPKYIQYLNSRTSWIKMASSVIVNPDPSTQTPEEQFIKTGESGIFRLKQMGLDTEQFKGYKLASSFILFNGTQQGTLQNESETFDDEGNLIYVDPTVGGKFTGYTKRKKISTSNSNWNNAAYGLGGTDFGLQPMPGITSLDVKHINRGSIRKATVTLKAYNKFQFEVINTLYLRLGFNMLLEWGNSHYIESSGLNGKNTTSNIGDIEEVRNTLTEETWFNIDYAGSTNLELLQTIEKYREKYDGNYDGFMGRVVNFSWDYNTDGSYSITIELASLGDVIESFKINTFSNNFNIQKPENTDTITAFLNDLTSNPSNFNTQTNNSNFIDLQTLSENNDFPDVPDDFRHYIRLGNLLEFIEKHVLVYFSNKNSNPFPIVNIDFNSEVNVMPLYPNQFSFDPKICLIRTTYFSPPLRKDLFFYKPMRPFSSEGELPYGKIMNIYLNFKTVKDKIKSNTDNKGNLSLFNFLKSLCDELNKALGGINNLEPIVIEDKNTLVILDQNNYPDRENIRKQIIEKENLGKEEETSFPIDLFGYNRDKNSSNFVKNFSLRTEIDNSLATTLTIGATAGGQVVGEDVTSFSQWNKGLTDRYKQFQAPPIPVNINNSTPQQSSNAGSLGYTYSYQNTYTIPTSSELKKLAQIRKDKILNNFENYLFENFGNSYKNSPIKNKFLLYTKFDRNEYQDWVNLGKQSFKNNLSNLNEEKGVVTSTLGFIPLKLQLTLDGLSGIKIYQKLRVNAKFLPSNYPNVLEFLVTKVDHNLSDNGWTTQIETLSIPVVQEIPIETQLSETEFIETVFPPGLVFSLPIQNLIGPPRIRQDEGGSGFYGANREPLVGSDTPRKHTGVDFSTTVGQEIFSPIPGNVQITRATNQSKLDGIKIFGKGEFEGITVYIFYSQLSLPAGTTVSKGEKIGNALDLSPDYPEKVTDHIHFKIEYNEEIINPDNVFYDYQGRNQLGRFIFGGNKISLI